MFQQLTRYFAGKFGADRPENDYLNCLVYKLRPISHYSNSWEWTIVERCNGKSIRKIVETLYFDELNKGAWLVDIGIWKSLFDRAVVATVYKLAHTGEIGLIPDVESWRDTLPAKAGNRREMSKVRNAYRLQAAESADLLTIASGSQAELSKGVNRLHESDINAKGSRLEQVGLQTSQRRSVPIGDKPGESERPEEWNGDRDAGLIGQRTRKACLEGSLGQSEKGAARNGAGAIGLGGWSPRLFPSAVEPLPFLRRVIPNVMRSAINLWRHASESAWR